MGCRWLARLRATVSRWLAAFDAMVDGLDVYGPGSRAGEQGQGAGDRRR